MAATIQTLSALWDALAQDGYETAGHAAGTIYPMPGSTAFDDDDAFLNLAIFPPDEERPVTSVRDDEWVMPVAWLRSYETRPVSQRCIKFRYGVGPGVTAVEMSSGLFVRRAAYLEIFRSRKPYSISTLRNNAQLYNDIAEYAVTQGVLVSDLDYADLLSIIDGLTEFKRARVSAAHEMMRWWRASAPESFTGYMPPPMLGADAETASNQRKGFDASRVRGEALIDGGDDGGWQPLPDPFVAKMGEFCLWVVNDLRPTYHAFLSDLLKSGRDVTGSEIGRVAATYRWPSQFEVRNIPTALKVGNVCQFSALFLVSLMLGPRWSEVSALPRKSLIAGSDGSYLLDGSTFKYSQNLSGEHRNWPVHPDLAKALGQQQEYIDLTEAPDFEFLWRSHTKVLNSGQPLRQVQVVLEDMAGYADCDHLLEGTSFHHHRFRKTTARLIVLALHGGPLVLRRLFGHQHLGITLRYMLANRAILDELREIAEEEQRQLAARFVERRNELRGGGTEEFKSAITSAVAQAEIYVPDSKREQATITTEDILNVLSADPVEGLYLKQIVPGLIACFKPTDEAGMCSKAGELPNVAKCSMQCKWHLEMPEYRDEARQHVKAALDSLRSEAPNSLRWVYFSDIVRSKLTDFPDLLPEFVSDPLVGQLVEARP